MGRFSKLELPDDRSFPRPEPGERRDWLALGDRCLRDGTWDLALRYYSRALADNSKLERAWLGQVLCLLNLGEYPEVVTWCDRALGIFPQSADLMGAKAVAWGRAGDLERALAFSDASMKMGNTSGFVWWTRGDILIGTNAQTAAFCFEKALELAPKDAALMLWIGKTYLSMGNAAAARKYLLRADQCDRDNPVVWYYLGLAYKDLGMREEAARAFRHVLSKNSRHDEARRALAEVSDEGFGQRLWRGVRAIFRST